MSDRHLSALARLACLGGLLVLFVNAPSKADSRLLVVSGLGGDQRFEESFLKTATQLYDSAKQAGVEANSLRLLIEDPELDPERPSLKSTRDNVLAALDELIAATGEDDELWVLLIGHGSFRDGTTRINLPGPDLTDLDLATRLTGLDNRRTVVVNTTSSSGGFLESLAAPGRVVVTATKSAAQRNETRFGAYFAAALSDLEADENRDERVSLLEAFHFASREVERYYETEKLLKTEQALLDDNGDGEGSSGPDALGGEDGAGDGLLAAQLHFGGPATSAPSVTTEVAGELGDRRRELSQRLVELRRQKGSLSEEVYNLELERLLIEIARIDQQLKSGAATDSSTLPESSEKKDLSGKLPSSGRSLR